MGRFQRWLAGGTDEALHRARLEATSAKASDAAGSQARAQWIAAGAAVLTLLFGVVVWLAQSSDTGGAAPATTENHPVQEAPVGIPTLEVSATWPTSRGCDGATSVALPAGAMDMDEALRLTDTPGGERASVVAHGGGSWLNGHLYLSLASSSTVPIEILNLRPVVESAALGPAAAVYEPNGGCGGSLERVFDLDLDVPALVDKGLVDDGGAVDDPASVRTEDLGPTFKVTDSDTAIVRIDVHSCRASYRWSLEISYSVAGVIERTTKGPYVSMGLHDENTVAYSAESGPGTPIAPVKELFRASC